MTPNGSKATAAGGQNGALGARLNRRFDITEQRRGYRPWRRVERRKGRIESAARRLLEHRLVEFVPVVQVVQVHRAGMDRAFIGDAAGAQDALAGAVVVD